MATRRVAPSRHPPRPPVPKAVAAAIARLRKICLALPDAVEKVAWGEPTWRAGAGKLFAQLDTYHHRSDKVAVWLPARAGLQEELVAEDPVQFYAPPYVGSKGWIGVRIDRRPDWNVIAGLVADAYRQVATPKLIARLDAAPGARKRGWKTTALD